VWWQPRSEFVPAETTPPHCDWGSRSPRTSSVGLVVGNPHPDPMPTGPRGPRCSVRQRRPERPPVVTRALSCLPRCRRTARKILPGDKRCAGCQCARDVRELDAIIARPRDIRQRMKSSSWTWKDLLTLERHGERIAQRLLRLAVCVRLNHQLGRASRALVDHFA
jgi:hypothetical protein